MAVVQGGKGWVIFHEGHLLKGFFKTKVSAEREDSKFSPFTEVEAMARAQRLSRKVKEAICVWQSKTKVWGYTLRNCVNGRVHHIYEGGRKK